MLRKTRSYKFWKEETATQVGQRLLVSSSDALVLTDIETFDLWELEHRRALIVEIIILVACFWVPPAQRRSKPLSVRSTFQQYMAIAYIKFY